MKKSLKYISVVLLSAMAFAACSLDTESMSSIDSQTYYKTQADAEAALVGCYDGYRRTVSGGGNKSITISFFVASEIMSDDCFGGTGHTDGMNHRAVDRFDKSLEPNVSNDYEGLWEHYYRAIFNVNSLLVQLDNISWESSAHFNTETAEQTRLAVEGEARFLRAVEYFDLVRMFGRVPLLTSPTKDVVPQAEPAELFELIFNDLKFAMENIKYVPTAAWHKSNDGRGTKEAAAAILARAYLFYTGYYGVEHDACSKQDAIDALTMIVNGGNYALVQAANDAEGVEQNGFKRLWRAASATDSGDGKLNNHAYVGRACAEAEVNEYLFSQKFNHTQDYNGVNTGNQWLVMVGLRDVTNALAVPYGRGWGACTVNPDAVKIFEEGDARKQATIIDIEGEGRGAIIDDAILSGWREFTGYNLKKYIPLAYNVDGTAVPEVQAESEWEGNHDFMISQYQDYIVVRYADVLLMLSELTEDAQYMNQVRQRAGLGDIAYSKENIIEERHREFMGEGIRYWDLLRQGVDYAADKIAGEWTVKSGGVDEQLIIDKAKFTATKGLCPIPDNQITASGGVYTQNDGWL